MLQISVFIITTILIFKEYKFAISSIIFCTAKIIIKVDSRDTVHVCFHSLIGYIYIIIIIQIDQIKWVQLCEDYSDLIVENGGPY